VTSAWLIAPNPWASRRERDVKASMMPPFMMPQQDMKNRVMKLSIPRNYFIDILFSTMHTSSCENSPSNYWRSREGSTRKSRLREKGRSTNKTNRFKEITHDRDFIAMLRELNFIHHETT
jgi:hypothetical protein